VQIRATIRSYYGQVRRAYRALRARLRSARAAVALLVLLLSLGEPLLCIVHCQIWLPIAYHSYSAAQHSYAHHAHHAHHGSANATMSDNTAAAGGAILVSAPLSASVPSYFMLRAAANRDGVPFHVPPSPVHDLLPTLVALIVLVLLMSIRPAAPPGDPPRILHPPQLRPPIPFAA
jgi:hypothetical protein